MLILSISAVLVRLPLVAFNAERIACFSISSRGMIGAAAGAAGFPIFDAELSLRSVTRFSIGGTDVGNEGGVEVGTIGGVEKFSGWVVLCEGAGKGGTVAAGRCDGVEKVGSGSGIGGLDEAVAETGMGAPTRLRESVGRPRAAVETGRPVSERMTARSMVF